MPRQSNFFIFMQFLAKNMPNNIALTPFPLGVCAPSHLGKILNPPLLHMMRFLPPANEVCEGYVFTPVCQSFCSWGGGVVVSQHALQVVSQHALQQVSGWGGVVSQHALQVCRPTPKGEVEGDLARGDLQAYTEGGFQAHTRGRGGACSGGACCGDPL